MPVSNAGDQREKQMNKSEKAMHMPSDGLDSEGYHFQYLRQTKFAREEHRISTRGPHMKLALG